MLSLKHEAITVAAFLPASTVQTFSIEGLKIAVHCQAAPWFGAAPRFLLK